MFGLENLQHAEVWAKASATRSISFNFDPGGKCFAHLIENGIAVSVGEADKDVDALKDALTKAGIK